MSKEYEERMKRISETPGDLPLEDDDVNWLIEQADEAVKYRRMYLDADKKKSEYWQYKIAFEKLVEVLNK